jgi:hypothetical protein
MNAAGKAIIRSACRAALRPARRRPAAIEMQVGGVISHPAGFPDIAVVAK